jgi:DnaK suppressor protein
MLGFKIIFPGEHMPSKKAQTAKKKTVKTRPVSGSRAAKKTTAKQVQKPKKTARKMAKPAAAPKAKPRKVEAKKPAPRAAASPKGVVAKPAAAPKKKLTPRELKIQDIRKTLVMQKNELLSEAEEALNSLPGQTIFPDMGDQASAEIDRNFMLRLRGREQRLLKKIDEAIEKIDSGIFGTCDVCGEEISLKRLEARPVTNMCIFCKTEQEEEEKMRGR